MNFLWPFVQSYNNYVHTLLSSRFEQEILGTASRSVGSPKPLFSNNGSLVRGSLIDYHAQHMSRRQRNSLLG